MTVKVQASSLQNAIASIFVAAGCSNSEAECISRHLVSANVCGHDSHGVLRVPRYVGYITEGQVVPNTELKVVLETDTLLVIDAGAGFGQPICEAVVERVAEKAKAAGVAIAAVRHLGHVGRLGDWAELLAERGLISLQFLNSMGTGMRGVPFGGSDRRLSPCPLAICVPRKDGPPVLVDITTTTVAEGKLAVARAKGQSVPEGWIVDKDGKPTTDPNDFYAGGALLPMAGHKGSGLNIVTDLLAGALSGGGCTRAGATEPLNNLLLIAIDPEKFAETDTYLAEVSRFCEWVKGSPPVNSGSDVLLPGEIEAHTKASRENDGIELDDTTWADIIATANRVGVPTEVFERLARAA